MLIWHSIFIVLYVILLAMIIEVMIKTKPRKEWCILLLYATILQLFTNIAGIFEKWSW